MMFIMKIITFKNGLIDSLTLLRPWEELSLICWNLKDIELSLTMGFSLQEVIPVKRAFATDEIRLSASVR